MRKAGEVAQAGVLIPGAKHDADGVGLIGPKARRGAWHVVAAGTFGTIWTRDAEIGGGNAERAESLFNFGA